MSGLMDNFIGNPTNHCPMHGCYFPINELCPQCWDDAKRGGVTMRPAVSHYQRGGIEPIDYIRSHNLNHCEGNIIKYVTRWPFKGDPIGDLMKARDYLNWLIEDAQSVPPPPVRPMPSVGKVNHLAAKDGVPAVDADKLRPQKPSANKR